MGEKITAEMRFAFPDERRAEIAFNALQPEFSNKNEKRAATTASIKKNMLAFSIKADDLAAMKASMLSNSRSIAFINELTNGGFV